MRPALSALAALIATACAAPAFAQDDGDILHYLRSNQDGSMPEAVSVWLRDDGTVEVFKRVSPCTNAALVTAEFDRTAGQPTRLVGGRLGRDGRQQPFAWLDHLPAERRLVARLGSPDAEPFGSFPLNGAAPWRLYDFDFADWNALADGPPPDRFTLELALAWPDEELTIRNLGPAEAVLVSTEVRDGRSTRRYAVRATGFSSGDLWLDAETGHVVEVAWGEPNHPGYDNFRLVLTGQDQGEAAWRALLASHWADCPT